MMPRYEHKDKPDTTEVFLTDSDEDETTEDVVVTIEHTEE